MRILKRALSLVLILLMLTALCGCGSKAPDLKGVWKGELDLGPIMIKEIDSSIAEMDTGVELPSFGDYMDSLPCQIRMEFKDDGTYLQTVEESSLDSMREKMFASTVNYYYEFFRVVLAAQLAKLGVESDMSTREGLEAVLGMSMDDAIQTAMGSDMETFVHSIIDGLWTDMSEEMKQEGQYKVEEGKLYLSDSPEHRVDSKIYHPFTYENGVLTLEKGVGTDTEEEYDDLYPLVLRAA